MTQQQEEWAHKQRAQFQQFDGAIRDKDEVIQSLKQELADNRERHLHKLDQALQDAERRAQQSTPMFAGTSIQPYATRGEEDTECSCCCRPRSTRTSFPFPGSLTWSISRSHEPEEYQCGNDCEPRLHQHLRNEYLAWV